MGIERVLFSLESCLTVAQSLGEDAEIVPFAEELLREKACRDFDALQDLVELAYHRSLSEDPPENPFQIVSKMPRPGDSTRVARASEPKVALPDSMPDFTAIADLGEDPSKAGEFMHQLLTAGQEMGCSDLHLCAGARPFVRLNGALCYLDEADLAAGAAQALNTALLNEAQRKAPTCTSRWVCRCAPGWAARSRTWASSD